jgi:hypothetical protein
VAKRFDPSRYHVPASHRPALEVPRGGSSCANCVLYSEEGGRHGSCKAEGYKTYYGTRLLPMAADRFCSDWYEPKKSELG